MKKPCKLLSLLVLLLMSLFLPALAETDFGQIRNLLEQGKLDQALSATDAVLAGDKENMQALFIKGLIYTRMNKLDQAEKLFLQLNRDHPELPEPYNNLAVIYASRGQFEKAREALQNAINTHPSYATAHENLGDIYARMASQAYNQALELDNTNVAAREKLSMISELFSASTPGAAKEPEPAMVTAATPQIAQTEAPKPAPAPQPESQPAPITAPEPVAAEVPPPAVPVAKASPVEKKPAAATGEIPESQIRQTILNNIDNWSKAWSRQDLNAYLSYFANDYSPSRDMSHSDWVAQRELRLTEPAYIKVDISGIKIVLHGDEHAQATFQQDYQSDTYSDSVIKTLLFRKLNDRWLIVQEKTE